MTRALLTPLVCLVTAGAASAYPIVAVDGVLDGVADGTFDIVVEVSDDTGDVLLTQSVPNFVVVDGLVTIDLDLGVAAAALEGGEVLSVTVEIDELSSTARLGSVLSALSADDADVTALAVVAERLGDIPAASLVQTGAVGGVAVAFANVAGLPDGIADGDDGNVFALRDLVITAGSLEVAPGAITSARVIDGTITSTQIANGSVNSVNTGAIGADRLANATLSGRNFADDAFAAADVSGLITLNRMAPGCENPRSLSTLTSCRRAVCGTDRLRNCTTAVCENAPNPSVSTLLCSGSSEGIASVSGRLVE